MAKILIVDDFPDVHLMIQNIVETGGHEIVGKAFSSPEAQTLFRKMKPDLVLLDLILPGESGSVCLQKLLAMDSSARVIIVTGAPSSSNVYQAVLDAGAAFILHKPFTSESLKASIDTVLQAEFPAKKK